MPDKILLNTVTMPLAKAAALGQVTGVSTPNKYGRAPDGVQATATDIWDRADATPTQQVWTAPTQARVHAIVSTDDTDGKTAAPSSVGARTIQVYGLTDWDTKEVSEIVTLDGTTGVNTTNSYVIIHRMRVLTWGTAGPNAGTISATAAVDGSVTAAILIGAGQTKMAIYGVPSTQTIALNYVYGYLLRAGGAAAAIDIKLLVNPIPDSQLAGFITKFEFSVVKDGNSGETPRFIPERIFPGPCIVKMQGIATAADQDVMAGFDGELWDN